MTTDGNKRYVRRVYGNKRYGVINSVDCLLFAPIKIASTLTRNQSSVGSRYLLEYILLVRALPTTTYPAMISKEK